MLRSFWVAFDHRLRELGYVEGQSLAVEFIHLDGQIEGMAEGMKELVRRKVHVIIASGVEASLKSALAATDTLPIVMVAIDYDPFARGYVRQCHRAILSAGDSVRARKGVHVSTVSR